MKNPLYLSFFLLPLFALLLFYSHKKSGLEELERKITLLSARAAEEKKEKEKELISPCDPYFLDKYVESLPLLEPEMKRLAALLPHHFDNEALAQRLKFLKDGQNKILFIEEKRTPRGSVQEIEEKLQHSVEMNEEDLKKLLVLVEGVTIHPYSPKMERPDISVLEFDLTRKKSFNEEEVFEVDLKLLMVTK